jgi:branched-chain amino acid transport system ATP-binding protein
MTGNAVAATWRPMVQTVPYGILMGLADRFFVFALFGGELLSVTGFLIDTVILIGISLLAYRMTLARKMVGQYPWLYERTGLLGWREKGKG